MGSIDELVPSKSSFLTKEDVGEQGENLTIKDFVQQEVGYDNDKELKYCIEWNQSDYKPMVLNRENASRLKMICKTDDTTAMIGVTVNVYNDPFVTFGKKIVGGLRIRPTQNASPQARRSAGTVKPTASPPVDVYADDPEANQKTSW